MFLYKLGKKTLLLPSNPIHFFLLCLPQSLGESFKLGKQLWQNDLMFCLHSVKDATEITVLWEQKNRWAFLIRLISLLEANLLLRKGLILSLNVFNCFPINVSEIINSASYSGNRYNNHIGILFQIKTCSK